MLTPTGESDPRHRHLPNRRLPRQHLDSSHHGFMLAGLIALFDEPRATFRFVGQLIPGLLFVLLVVSFVLVGFALLGR